IFDDQLESTRACFDRLASEKGHPKIPSSNLFRNWRSYEELAQSKGVDLVLIASPPYFHPDHFEAAVAAGKHVYLETPAASDVHGCLRVLEAARKAEGRLTVHVGLWKRYDEGYHELFGRIRAGELGPLRKIYISHNNDYFDRSD